jgi:hypothetical protein
LIIDDQSGETNPEVIYVLLQTAASDLERATEVCKVQFLYCLGKKCIEKFHTKASYVDPKPL